ncbi:MAG: hypothetical protein ACAH88_04225, partial [Roseimicrobium sp.]
DMNAVQNMELDRGAQEGNLPVADRDLKELLQSMGLVESFRELNPHTRAFSYNKGDGHSRIDQIWVDEQLIQCTTEAKVWSIRMRDHEPVSLTLAVPACQGVQAAPHGAEAVRYNFPEVTRATVTPNVWK